MANRFTKFLSRFRRKQNEQTVEVDNTKPTIQRPRGDVMWNLRRGQDPLINFDTLYFAVKHHSDTMACIRYLQNTVGRSGFSYEPVGQELTDPNPQSVEKANQLLFGIDGRQSFKRKMRATVLHTQAVGNYFLVIERNVRGEAIGTVQLHPKTTTIVVTPEGEVKAYLQTVAGQPVKVFPPEDVTHFTSQIDPEDDVYGTSPLVSLISSEVEPDQKAAELNKKILDNDMKMPFIAILEEGIGDHEYERLAEWLRQSYSGYQNAGRPMVAGGVKDIKTISQTFADMQFLELRNMSRDKICAAFGVPKSVLGYRDSANEATAGKVDRTTVYQDTIIPIETDIEERINNDLFIKAEIDDIRFVFNTSSAEETEQVEASSRSDMERSIMTINEARKERNLDEYPEDLPAADEPMFVTPSGPILLRDIRPGAFPDGSESSQNALRGVSSKKMDEDTAMEILDKLEQSVYE